MCKVKKMSPLWGFLLSFPLWTVSCVDNKYDLDKDIDMTVNVGGEYLTIPAGSSDTAYLSKIIEVEEGDILQPDATTRVYHLTKKDDISVEPTVVAQVTINGAETSLEKGLAEFSIGDEVEATVDVELDESNSLEAVADDIDEALKELGALEAQTPATMTVTFEFDGGLKFDEVKAKNLKVKFPDFLVFEKGEVEEGNTLTLNETLSTTPRKLNVIGYRFGDKPDGGIPVVDGNISILNSATLL